LTILLFSFALSRACAQEQEVQMLVNELRIFPVHELIRVAVGDPGIADITVLSERELMVIAKGTGATSLIVWDKAGQRSFNITVAEKNLEKAAQRIRELLVFSEIRGVTAKTEEDNIYVLGEVFSEREVERVKEILTPFANAVNLVKAKERQPLVEIDVNVLEVGVDEIKKLGLDWSNSLSIKYTEPTDNIEGNTLSDAPKLWRVLRWDRDPVDARLHFLITEANARTLANPKLVTLSGKEASFLVGGEVPYVTVETEGRTSVQWKEYGVNLKILPLVNAKNEINTKIKAEVTDLDRSNAVIQQGYNIPAVKTREVQTELFLNEGDIVFLAGLIKNEDSQGINRLPWLSKVPILGELFKSKEFRDKRTELVISISPRIIGEKAQPEYISQEILKQEAILKAQRRFPAYSEETSPLAYYTHMIEDIITNNVVYPDQAREEELEGLVKIDLCLLSNGELKEARIRESSGFKVLDEAALTAVQELTPYPSFPEQVTQRQLRLTVPVVFKGKMQDE